MDREDVEARLARIHEKYPQHRERLDAAVEWILERDDPRLMMSLRRVLDRIEGTNDRAKAQKQIDNLVNTTQTLESLQSGMNLSSGARKLLIVAAIAMLAAVVLGLLQTP